MHVQMINVDDMGRFGEGLRDVAIFVNAAPDYVGAHRLMQNRLVGNGNLAVDNGFQWLVFDVHKLGAIFSNGGVSAITAATGSP